MSLGEFLDSLSTGREESLGAVLFVGGILSHYLTLEDIPIRREVSAQPPITNKASKSINSTSLTGHSLSLEVPTVLAALSLRIS